jgi:alkanesulfonate monooxygenase SsuD/methylene tetrahydromethanopterin reductase-like flavin-dependent oxidoreductase (luciferase family)
MKFGIGYYSLQSPPHNPRKHADLYREMLSEIESAEEMGFDSAWLTEHHFLADGYCPSLMVTAAAIAARTSKIRIGTGVLLMPLHNAIRIAEDAAVVDLISGGRFILGLGLGYRSEEFEGFGVSLKHRRDRMEESLEILIKSWKDEKFSLHGTHYSIKDLNVTPKPVQRPIPIWIGAFTEPAIRRAARIGASLYVPAIGIIPIIKSLFDMHTNMLKEYNYDPNKVEKPIVREMYITDNESGDSVWERIKEHVTYTAKGYASWGSMVDTEGNLLSDPDDPKLYDIARKQSIIGTPQECVDIISEYKEQLPIDNLICRFKFPGISHEDAMRSMRLFTDKVLPKLS